MPKKRTFEWDGVEYQSPEYYRLWRLANKDKSRAYHRLYDRMMYLKHPDRERARRNRWKSDNPEKVKAHSKVSRALKAGELIKKPCSVCRSVKVIAHHDDYSKPLDVLWLCEIHHKARHRDSKEIIYATAPQTT